MIGEAMSAAAAANVVGVPLDDFVEQAHPSLVGNVPFNPGMV